LLVSVLILTMVPAVSAATAVSIYDIQFTADASGDSPYVGQEVVTQGIVTAAFADNVFIQDGTGGWSGLLLYKPGGDAVTVGDEVEVTGTVSEYNGLTQIGYGGAVVVLSSGNPLPAAEILASGDVAQEQWESVFVRVEGAWVTDDNLGYGEWEIDDGSGAIVVDDLGTASITYTPLSGDFLGYVQGPLIWSYGAFKIEPRDDGDIQVLNVSLSEIRIDQPGTDTDEYFELAGDDGTDLSGFTYIVIGDGSAGSGVVEAVIDLSGESVPASGYFVAVEETFTSTLGTATMTTTLNFENSDNVTHMLVWGFDGAQDDDLDTDDDGVLDTEPWEEVVDCVALVETEGSGDQVYCETTVGPDGSYVPGHAYACYGDWMIGAFDPEGGVDTPGAENDCEVCGDPVTYIYEVQGSGGSTPLGGEVVSVEGVVTGDFVEGLNGFAVQDPTGDGDAATSDGVFVYAPGADVDVGDAVRVRGVAGEYYGLTQISSVSLLLDCGDATPVAPTNVSIPGDMEPFEGMLVNFPDGLYISEYFNFDRFGEIVLTTERQFQPTATFDPGTAEALALAEENAAKRITLDDGRGSQNPDPAFHPNGAVFDLTNLFRGGDLLHNVTGIVDYAFGQYKIQPTQGADYTPANPRPLTQDDVGGTLEVASFNVLNYFTTIDTGSEVCGPAGDQGCRGADTAEEFTRQRNKIIAALVEMNADVVGLIEIENAPDDTPTADLVSGLNDVLGAGTYEFVATGATGTDAIRNAFIYKPATVSLVGGFAVLDDASFTDPLGYGQQKSRPALAQTFVDNATGGVFTVAVNHLKSKGSSCGPGDDDPEAGSCNVTRALGAEALAAWLATDPTGSGDADFMIIGDLNAYDKEDPVDALLAGGYADLVAHFQGENAYSYVFDGALGYLDYALSTQAMVYDGEVTGTAVWHINADEPDLIDYDMSYKQAAQDAIYAPDAFRASDHDPVIAGLDVCDEIAPSLEITLSQEILWPVNHKYVTVTAEVDVWDNWDPNPQLELVSVTSSEADNDKGDGHTEDDIVIVDDITFLLRAERAGGGDGRVYTILYKVTDACGNETYGRAFVTVPHDQRKEK
jgi:predicted extracellular nuclease